MKSIRKQPTTDKIDPMVIQEKDFQSFVRNKLHEIQEDLKQMNKGIQEIKSNLKEINDYVAGNAIEILDGEQEDVSEELVEALPVLPSPVNKRRRRTSTTTTEEITFPLTTEVCDGLEERLRAKDVDLKVFLVSGLL